MLLVMAKKDLKALNAMMDPEDFEDEIFGFHVQQATEKVVKAWLVLLNIAYPKTHDLYLLVDILQSYKIDFSAWEELTNFTEFSVQYRYEAFDTVETFSRKEASQLLNSLVAHVQGLYDNYVCTL